MEQHPVPRNISGFQFHLIGDMTLRQFAFLAGGAFLGYVTYRIAPFPSIINAAFGLSFGLAGFAFAFVPIQDRPLDKWLAAFIKSILSPTQYVWCKANLPPEILLRSPIVSQTIVVQPAHIDAHKEAQTKLRTYLATLPKLPHETLNAGERQYIGKTMALFQTAGTSFIAPSAVIPPTYPTPAIQVQPLAQPVNLKPQTVPAIQSTPQPIVSPLPETIDLKSTQPPIIKPLSSVPTLKPIATQVLPANPQEIKPIIQPATPPIVSPPPLGTEFANLKDQLTSIAAEKEMLVKELTRLKQDISRIKSPQVVKPELSSEPQTTPTITTMSARAAVSGAGLPQLPQYPNIIIGVVKDADKKLLPNIILTIKDKNGMPLRALKTNKLGQFAIATPLSDGTYFLELEDPLKRFVFDIAEVSLTGKIFLPVEIIAKGQKELMREQLTKEIFGSATM